MSQARAYPIFCSMEQLLVFLLPLDGKLVHYKVTPSIKFAATYSYTSVERGTLKKVIVLPKNTTQCPQQGLEPGPLAPETSCTNHKATGHPLIDRCLPCILLHPDAEFRRKCFHTLVHNLLTPPSPTPRAFQIRIISIRVVAKKIVSQTKIFINPVIIFPKRPGTKFLSVAFCNALNAGLLSFTFTKWWTQYTEREHAKQALKIKYYFNYFTHYGDTDTQGSQEFIPKFSFRWFNVVQILSDRPPKSIQ